MCKSHKTFHLVLLIRYWCDLNINAMSNEFECLFVLCLRIDDGDIQILKRARNKTP